MCGRYVIITKVEEVKSHFRADILDRSVEQFPLRSNLSVGQLGLIIVSNGGRRSLMTSTFGLSPAWSDKRRYLFNARAEGDHNRANDPSYSGSLGIITKASFRSAIRQRRCLIPADGFIEGPTEKKLKEPYLCFRPVSPKPFAMAGIYEDWVDKETGEVLRGYSIITTVSNELTQALGHHRSPAVIQESDTERWLDEQSPLDQVLPLLRKWDSTGWNAYPISPEIRSPKAIDLEFLRPLGPCLLPESRYESLDIMELYGMGESRARNRRQPGLFD